MSVISASSAAICWPPLKTPNSPAVLISLMLFGGPPAMPMILAFEACACSTKDDRSGVAKRRTHRAQHLAALGGDHRGGVALQRMAEGVVVGDEEPASRRRASPPPARCRPRARGCRTPIAWRRALQNLPWKSAAPVEWVMNSFFFSLAMVCTARPTAETGTSTIKSTCSTSYQRRAMRAADVRLELVVADDDADRLAQHLAAEIVDRHLRRGHRALAGRRRGRPVHVGEHADLDDVVGDLGEGRRRRGP